MEQKGYMIDSHGNSIIAISWIMYENKGRLF